MLFANWPGVDIDSATATNPLRALARGDIAAILFRQAFPAAECRALIHFLIDESLMFESGDPRIEEKALTGQQLSKYVGAKQNIEQALPRRIDIGTSLGTWGDDPERFFAKAAETHELYARLFRDRPDPVKVIYKMLQQLAPTQRVMTAQEPDGRRYGPAIFRTHYGGFSYGPHFDSVRNREKRSGYAVHKFDHQFAGVLCLQNATRDGVSAQAILHQQSWMPALDAVLAENRFHEYARERGISHLRVDLEAGDLYFFNTGMIHEVPGVAGDLPRIVLATFIGYSDAAPEIMVWS